jgi:hypothetical protein
LVQVLKCYMIGGHALEHKLRMPSYHPGRPILNTLASTEMAPAIAIAGKPIINANLLAPSAMLGNNTLNSVAINTPTATSIAKIRMPNTIVITTNTGPQLSTPVKIMIAKTGMPVKLGFAMTIAKM